VFDCTVVSVSSTFLHFQTVYEGGF
jgi:hypothetical protein